MKLFSLSVLFKGPDKVFTLKAAHDLSMFGYFQRSSVQEFMTFTTQILVERTVTASRASVREQDYMCHVYVRGDNLASVLISDHEYPNRVAHTMMTKVLDDFTSKVPSHQWSSPEGNVNFSDLDVYLMKYQNPKEADALTKMQSDLDETKIILHGTIEAVLERGEKLDDLVAKSEDLSMQSKAFYKTAKKTNSCCKML